MTLNVLAVVTAEWTEIMTADSMMLINADIRVTVELRYVRHV